MFLSHRTQCFGVLGLVLAACSGLTSQQPRPEVVRSPVDASAMDHTRKLLVIGLDGVRYDTMQTLQIPVLRALAARGIFSRTWIYAPPFSPTLSGPGWSTIATGVWPDKHRVLGNDFAGHQLPSHPDFLTRLERQNPSFNTAVFAAWPPIAGAGAPGPVFGSEVDHRVSYDGDHMMGGWTTADQRVTNEAASYLRERNPDAIFVYLGNPDIVAHNRGAGVEYRFSIETADRQVGELLAAIEARATRASEDWLIVVTTDHGHRDAGGHGGASWQERQSFVLAAGGPITHRTLEQQPRLVDLVPTFFSHLRVPIDPSWEFDGVSLEREETDVFDVLRSRLQPARDERSIPANVLGWTQETPPGWSIDNSRMTNGGVTEWRGWTFVDEAFWSAAEQEQGREGFVRSRGVIAVADPDEWDDLGAPSGRGTFDSTLSSAPYSVAGRSAVRVRFRSHYRQDGTQTAQVLAAFDGGTPVEILRYGGNPTDRNGGGDVSSKIETLSVSVPSGVRSMVLQWRLFNARNNYFWAVDAPEVL